MSPFSHCFFAPSPPLRLLCSDSSIGAKPVSPWQPVIQSFLVGRLFRPFAVGDGVWWKADHTLRRVIPGAERSRLPCSVGQAADAGRWSSLLQDSGFSLFQRLPRAPSAVALASAFTHNRPRRGRKAQGAAPFVEPELRFAADRFRGASRPTPSNGPYATSRSPDAASPPRWRSCSAWPSRA